MFIWDFFSYLKSIYYIVFTPIVLCDIKVTEKIAHVYACKSTALHSQSKVDAITSVVEDDYKYSIYSISQDEGGDRIKNVDTTTTTTTTTKKSIIIIISMMIIMIVTITIIIMIIIIIIIKIIIIIIVIIMIFHYATFHVSARMMSQIFMYFFLNHVYISLINYEHDFLFI